MTYVQKGRESQTYVIRWDGTAFVQVGDSLVTETTLDAHGRPMVTWLTPPAPGQSQPGIQVRVNH